MPAYFSIHSADDVPLRHLFDVAENPTLADDILSALRHGHIEHVEAMAAAVGAKLPSNWQQPPEKVKPKPEAKPKTKPKGRAK